MHAPNQADDLHQFLQMRAPGPQYAPLEVARHLHRPDLGEAAVVAVVDGGGLHERQDVQAPFAGLRQRGAQHVHRQPLALDVQLESGDAGVIPRDLEVHGPQTVLPCECVGCGWQAENGGGLTGERGGMQ